jgi:hypothetical protein
LPDALAIVRAQHYEIAAVDPERGQFVAVPATETAPGVKTAMVVNLGVRDKACWHGARCIAGSRTVVTVTPVALRGGALVSETAEARDNADDLSWAILSSARY